MFQPNFNFMEYHLGSIIMIKPLEKPSPINVGKPGAHIALNKEYTPIPECLLKELSNNGVIVGKSSLRFRL